MVYEVLHFVLVNGARLASAVLPAIPLLGLKRPAASPGKNIVLVQDAFADGEVWVKGDSTFARDGLPRSRSAKSDGLAGRRGGFHQAHHCAPRRPCHYGGALPGWSS